jgi:hypothetical protein
MFGGHLDRHISAAYGCGEPPQPHCPDTLMGRTNGLYCDGRAPCTYRTGGSECGLGCGARRTALPFHMTEPFPCIDFLDLTRFKVPQRASKGFNQHTLRPTRSCAPGTRYASTRPPGRLHSVKTSRHEFTMKHRACDVTLRLR